MRNHKSIYYRNRHSCFLLQYQLVLVTKYRKPVLVDSLYDRVVELTEKYFHDHDFQVLDLQVHPDYMLVSFEASPNEKICDFVNGFKTFTSRKIRKEYADFLSQQYEEPIFWSNSYLVTTLSEKTENAVNYYLEHQDKDV